MSGDNVILGLDAQISWIRISLDLELFSPVAKTDNFRKSKIRSNKMVTWMYWGRSGLFWFQFSSFLFWFWRQTCQAHSKRMGWIYTASEWLCSKYGLASCLYYLLAQVDPLWTIAIPAHTHLSEFSWEIWNWLNPKKHHCQFGQRKKVLVRLRCCLANADW